LDFPFRKGATALRLVDYARRLFDLSATVHRWLGALGQLEEARRLRVARYADRIAATLARTVSVLECLQESPGDRAARTQAVRELGRVAGYIETMVGPLEHHLDGRKLAGVKRRLELLRPGEIHKCVVLGLKPAHIERLAAAEGYFRALADGLRT